MNLKQIFGNVICSSAFQVIDDEIRIVGKYAQVSLTENGYFDIWLIQPGFKPISVHKLTNIIQCCGQGVRATALNGEAYIRTWKKESVLQALSQLGIRAKRKASFSVISAGKDISIPVVVMPWYGFKEGRYQRLNSLLEFCEKAAA